MSGAWLRTKRPLCENRESDNGPVSIAEKRFVAFLFSSLEKHNPSHEITFRFRDPLNNKIYNFIWKILAGFNLWENPDGGEKEDYFADMV